MIKVGYGVMLGVTVGSCVKVIVAVSVGRTVAVSDGTGDAVAVDGILVAVTVLVDNSIVDWITGLQLISVAVSATHPAKIGST
jgi:hypothetical protein